MGLIEKWKECWTEQLPEPLPLTDTEILDWDAEYVEECLTMKETRSHPGGITLYVCGISPTWATTRRKAVCLAAAKFKEVNE